MGVIVARSMMVKGAWELKIHNLFYSSVFITQYACRIIITKKTMVGVWLWANAKKKRGEIMKVKLTKKEIEKLVKNKKWKLKK